MHMRCLLRIQATLSGEGPEVGPEDVEGSEPRRGGAQEPDEGMAVDEGRLEHHVLREEGGETRNASDREGGNEEGTRGDRHLRLQAAHVGHAKFPV